MKILLTGHKGFVGKALREYLESKDIEVVGYDLPEDDILNPMNLFDKIKDVDLVIHNAAIADLNDTWLHMNKNFEVNIRGTYNVGDACSSLQKRMIFISTCCVYGNTSDIFETEDRTIPKTIEPYACSKMAGEYIVRGSIDLDYTILRIGTVYGPGMRPALFNYIALDKVHNEQEIMINGDGHQTRNYIYIDDLVDGIYKTCVTDLKNRETINLCGNEQTSILDTIHLCEEITGKKAIYKWDVYGRYGEIQDENISNDKAGVLLEWEPETSYIDGMKKTYESIL